MLSEPSTPMSAAGVEPPTAPLIVPPPRLPGHDVLPRGSRGRRRSRRGIRLLIAIGLVIVGVLALTGLGRLGDKGTPASLPDDPTASTAAAIAWRSEQALRPAMMPGWVTTKDYEVAQADLVQGSGLAIDDVRQRTVRGAHQREFLAVDGRYELSTRVWETTSARRAAFRHTDIVALAGSFPPGARAWVGRDDAERRGLVLEMSRGRTFVEMTLEVAPIADGGPPTATVAATLADLATRQASLLHDAPDLDTTAQDHRDLLHWALIVTVLGYLLWFQLLVAAVTAVSDRGFRDHLLAWVAPTSRRPTRLGLEDPDTSEGIVRGHRAHRRGVVLRSIVVGVAIVVVYEAKLDGGIPAAIGVLAATAFTLTVGQVLLARRRARRDGREVPSVAVSAGLVGAALFSVVAASAGAFVVFMMAMSVFATPAEVSPEQKQGALQIYLFLGVCCFLVADVPSRWVRRGALRRASARAERDPRPGILFLRSFADDGRRIRVRRGGGGSMVERWSLRRREGFEQLLVLALGARGPVTAVGEPGTRLPPLGAVRRYYGDEWRGAVDRMAAEAQLVVFVVGRSRGVHEEVVRVRQRGLLHRCLFVVPPLPRREATIRLRVLASALQVPGEVLTDVDETGAHLLALSVAPDGHPICWRASGRTDVAYRVIVDAAAGLIAAAAAWSVRVANVAVGVAPIAGNVDALLVTSANRADARRTLWRKRRQRLWLVPVALNAVLALMVAGGDPLDRLPVPGAVEARASLWWMGQRSDGSWLGVSDDGHAVVALQGGRAVPRLTIPERALTAAINWDTVLVSATAPNMVVAVSTDASGAQVAWRAPMPARPGAAAVVGSRIVVLLPERDAAAVLDRVTGRNMGTIRLPRGPRALAVVGDTVWVAGETDATLIALDLAKQRVVRTVPLPVSPSTLVADGPDLFVGSIVDNTVLRVAPGGPVLARLAVPQLDGVLAVDRTRVTVGTYGDPAFVISLRRTDLGEVARQVTPDTLDGVVGAGDRTMCSFSDRGLITSVP